MIKEKNVEQHLTKQVAKLGGYSYKFTSPGRRSVPDRMVLFQGANLFFVECKAPGKKPTELQQREHDRLRELDFIVFVVDSYAAVDEILGEYINAQLPK